MISTPSLKQLSSSYESSFACFPLSWMRLCRGRSNLLSGCACVCGPDRQEMPRYQWQISES